MKPQSVNVSSIIELTFEGLAKEANSEASPEPKSVVAKERQGIASITAEIANMSITPRHAKVIEHGYQNSSNQRGKAAALQWEPKQLKF